VKYVFVEYLLIVEGVAFILKVLIYCLLFIFAGIFKGPWSN